MKKLLSFILVIAMLAIPMFVMRPAFAQQTLNLKAVWNPNAEPDLAGYHFFWKRYNGVTPTAGEYWKTGGWSVAGPADNLPLAPQQLLFSCTILDTPSTGTLEFSLTAFDTNSNQSSYSSPYASYAYNIDVTPPVAPTGLVISKQ